MDEALKEFWRNGYDRTSLDDLLKCMSINNSSFYQTFQSKEQLFVELLGRYRGTFGRERLAILNDEKLSPREALEGYFRHTIYVNTRQGFPVGCFMTNTMSSLADTKSVVAKLAMQSMTNIESNFAKVLVRAAAAKQLLATMEPAHGARLLLIFLTGLTSISRIRPSRKELLASAQAQIDLLLKKA